MPRLLLIAAILSCLSACTTGELHYTTPEGEQKTACQVEYTWQPSVDKYAVEYILAHCAQKATEQGNTVADKRLLQLNLSVPAPPEQQRWTHDLAKERHKKKILTDKEYGYLIACLDLNHQACRYLP